MNIFLVLLMLVTGCSDSEAFLGNREIAVVKSDGSEVTFKIEQASNSEEWAKGLMFYNKVKENHGMLFDFRETRPVSMWMKNTYVMLDMLFFDGEKKLVHIEENAKPLTLGPRGPQVPVRYVLEINGGEASKLGIKVGDRLDLKDLKND